MVAFVDDSGVTRFAGSLGGDVAIDGPVTLEPQAVGDKALVINAPAGAAANGDDEIEVIGDTGGFVFVGADGSMGASFDSSVGSGYTLIVDAENALRISANVTQLNGVAGATDGLRFKSHNAGSTLIQGLADQLGFFNAVPVSKPTGVAVSAAGIHAALVSLGLIGP